MFTQVNNGVEREARGRQKARLSNALTSIRRDLPPLFHRGPLYTPEQRRRRDASPWTIVQAILAPLQFLVFLVSLTLVLRCLVTGDGAALATASVLAKTLILYMIMVTGSLWERDVFGRYLFARAFFWEDVFSMLVIGLHTAYLVVLVTNILDVRGQLVLALAAYVTYVVNAAQFVIKLRAARKGASAPRIVERAA